MACDERLIITGGHRLEGETFVSGGKNTSVAVIAATLLCDEPCTVENMPDIEDVHVLCEILHHIGVQSSLAGGVLRVDPRGVTSCTPPVHLMKKLRASYYLLGALLTKYGYADIPYPGGCAIGDRPIDQHVAGMRRLGAEVMDTGEMVHARAGRLYGAEVFMDFCTVGGTINVLLAAARAEGNTIIFNAAKEPHVVDVANFLNSMGARIRGAGTDIIRVRGVDRLHSCTYTIIPDQIETGTLMIASAASHGDVTIRGCIPTHMESLTAKLLEIGVHITESDDVIRVRSVGGHRAANVTTQPYPGFPTDLQQPISAMLCAARGKSIVNETIYDDRFKHLLEMQRMGACFTLGGGCARIEGVQGLYGASVRATDLRASAALVIAGLMADGVTELSGLEFLDRGYARMEDKLRALGANIERVARTD